MVAAVNPNYAGFVAAFPEFVAISETQYLAYFNRAGLFCANDACNPALAIGILPQLLDLVTAHIAWMSAPRGANGMPAQSGQPASPLVGRINTASEGSVSVGTEYNAAATGEAFWVQTQYGAQYWAATAQFRTARYAANPTVVPLSSFPPYAAGGYYRRW